MSDDLSFFFLLISNGLLIGLFTVTIVFNLWLGLVLNDEYLADVHIHIQT